MNVKKFLVLMLWILVILPPIQILIDGIKAYFTGTYHGFNADEKIYGIQAFTDVIVGDILFGFIFVIVWFFLFLLTIYFTKKIIKKD